MRDQQFLKIIEAITTKGKDEDKRREEIRIAEARERDERLSEERIFAERLQKEEEKRLWLEQHERTTSYPGSLPTPGASGKTLASAGHVNPRIWDFLIKNI